MKFKAYPKIPSLKNLVIKIKNKAEFIGMQGEPEFEEPVFDESKLKPTIKFHGTVKLHGTNAGIMYDGEKIQPIKRSSTVTGGHFGFWEWCQQNEELEEEMDILWKKYGGENSYIILYGEWVGPGIQKGVAISKLPKKEFFAFDLRVVKRMGTINEEVDYKTTWIDPISINFQYISTVYDYEHYTISIDFNNPSDMQSLLEDIVEKVEKQCPIADSRGLEGLGEGVVWKGHWDNIRWIFKTKGEKHKVVKESKLVVSDPEKMASIQAFVDYACTDNRILQAIKTLERELQPREVMMKSHTPGILKWIAQDILSEELPTLKQSGLEWKDVVKQVSSKTREAYFRYLEHGSIESRDTAETKSS